MGALIDAEVARPRARRAAARARARRRTRAARSRAGSPKRRRCERSPASTCSRRPASRRDAAGSTAWVAAEAISSTRPSRGRARGRGPAGRRRAARGASSAVAVALGLGGAGRPSAAARRRRRRPRRTRSGTRAGTRAGARRRPSASSWSASTGRHRHRQPLGDVEHRHVGADHRVEQPLLAERIGPEALDVGHVAVEDESEVPHPALGAHRRQTARKSSARSRSHSAAGLIAKSDGRDRRHEPVVERLGDPQRRVDAVPADADRELVQRAACGRERRRRSRPRRTAARAAPRTPRPCTRAGARGSRTSRPPRAPASAGSGSRRSSTSAAAREAVEQRAGVVDVLDRLQEDDRVAGPA